jgi:hypothetical protein
MTKARGIIIGAIVAALIAFAWFQYRARVEAERSLGLDAARIVSAEFSRRADLRVATLRGTVVAGGTDKGFMGVVPSSRTTALPFTVEYYLNLSRVGERSYRWDAASRTLAVDIPDVTAGTPNINEAAGATDQKGLFISRRAALELARQTSMRAAAKSRQEAEKPENLAKARGSARAQVAKMAEAPLRAAGLEDVRVAVSFPWEPKNRSAAPIEQWDRSRAVEDVLNERKQARTP